MSLVFKNFNAASRKNNMVRFALFGPNQDLSWIDNQPNGPLSVQSISYSSTPAFDASLANVLTITLTGSVTSSTINFAGSGTIPLGQQVYLRIQQNATGGYTFALPGNLLTDPGYSIDPGPSRVTVLPIQFNGTNWEFFAAPFSFPAA